MVYRKENAYLILELCHAQMKARYRGTVSGFFWVVLGPIIMYSAQSIVFKHLLKIGIPHYGLFLLGGLLPWTFIVTALQMGVPALQTSRSLLLSFKISPFVIIVSSLLDNWINFLVGFLFILLPVIGFSAAPTWGLMLLPVAILVLFAGMVGILSFLSVFNVFYRDVKYVTNFSLNILFFITPIFYPIEFIPKEFQWAVFLNPLYIIIDPIRKCVFDFSAGEAAFSLLRGLIVSVVSIFIACLYWRKKRNEFYLYV